MGIGFLIIEKENCIKLTNISCDIPPEVIYWQIPINIMGNNVIVECSDEEGTYINSALGNYVCDEFLVKCWLHNRYDESMFYLEPHMFFEKNLWD